MADALLDLHGVTVRRGDVTLLGPLDLSVRTGERWAVIGPNGSGKTTLVQLLATNLWPSEGRVRVLDETAGASDLRVLRRRVGLATAGIGAAIAPERTPIEAVMTARYAALAPWWHGYTNGDRERAASLLGLLGVGNLAARPFGALSTGERQRVQIARALMPDPDLLLLDEPAAGLDLGAREALVDRIEALARSERPAAIVLVTHHVEEIPAAFGHALVLAGGRAVAAGPIEKALTGTSLGAAFGIPLHVEQRDGRWSARRA